MELNYSAALEVIVEKCKAEVEDFHARCHQAYMDSRLYGVSIDLADDGLIGSIQEAVDSHCSDLDIDPEELFSLAGEEGEDLIESIIYKALD